MEDKKKIGRRAKDAVKRKQRKLKLDGKEKKGYGIKSGKRKKEKEDYEKKGREIKEMEIIARKEEKEENVGKEINITEN